MNIQIRVLDKDFYTEGLPGYATTGSVAIDLIVTKDVIIWPQQRVKVGTGLAIWSGCLDKGLTTIVGKETVSGLSVAALILPRSGLGTRGLVLANTIGLIDSDYQGELIVSLWNSAEYGHKREITLYAGERFAQLLFIPVLKAQWNVVEEFTNTTDRGDGGFGSTGV